MAGVLWVLQMEAEGQQGTCGSWVLAMLALPISISSSSVSLLLSSNQQQFSFEVLSFYTPPNMGPFGPRYSAGADLTLDAAWSPATQAATACVLFTI